MGSTLPLVVDAVGYSHIRGDAVSKSPRAMAGCGR